ncbi:MAG: hypothetical protein K2I26_08140 [Paramuribaculum sp.]|nr:hypothetical protein [Paramuribaculum sp.]
MPVKTIGRGPAEPQTLCCREGGIRRDIAPDHLLIRPACSGGKQNTRKKN